MREIDSQKIIGKISSELRDLRDIEKIPENDKLRQEKLDRVSRLARRMDGEEVISFPVG